MHNACRNEGTRDREWGPASGWRHNLVKSHGSDEAQDLSETAATAPRREPNIHGVGWLKSAYLHSEAEPRTAVA